MPKVLVVDDEPSLRMTLAANLELEGFEAAEADSGEAALRRVAEEHFDLVLTDIQMGGMSGVELFRELRRRKFDVPVVLMTAFAVETLVDQALSEGAFTMLPKPFNMEHVIATVSRAAGRPAVLVVDDEEPVAGSTAAALAACGLTSRAVGTPEAALEIVRRGEVDVCVVDMLMPRVSGAELVTQLQASRADLLIIAVSGHDVPELVRRAAAEGAYTFFRKPFAVPDLVRAIALGRGKESCR